LPDRLQHPVGVLEQVSVGESQHTNAVRSEESGSPPVIALSLGREVLPSVQLDRQPARCTVEVDDVGSDRMLSAKLQTQKLAGTQPPPKQPFSLSGSPPKIAPTRERYAHDLIFGSVSEEVAWRLPVFRVVAPPPVSG
jgi:hypothetical protein